MAIDILIINEHIARVDADAKLKPLWVIYLTLVQAVLEFKRAANGLDRAIEFDQYAVPGGAYEPTAKPLDCRLDKFLNMASYSRIGASFVAAHHAAIADDIG